jgi:hypothetical protein
LDKKERCTYIAVDFDGTIVRNEYPKIGKSTGSEKWLKLISKDPTVKLILWTCRTDKELKEAIEWFENNNIVLFAVNDNPDQREWSSSSKVFADIYIDDRSIGCPLTKGRFEDKSFVDWNKVGPEILNMIKYRKVIK